MSPNRWQTITFLLIFTILKASDSGAANLRNVFYAPISPNEGAVYSLYLASLADTNGNSSGQIPVFCVANPSADPTAVNEGLNWACGPGSANCSAIQQGQPCYEANNLTALASYAYNDYYQMTRGSGGTCDFNHTAMLTTTDPSHGSCIFTGSTGATSNSSSSGGTIPISTPTGTAMSPIFNSPGFLNPGSGVPTLQVLRMTHLVLLIGHFWFYL